MKIVRRGKNDFQVIIPGLYVSFLCIKYSRVICVRDRSFIYTRDLLSRNLRDYPASRNNNRLLTILHAKWQRRANSKWRREFSYT